MAAMATVPKIPFLSNKNPNPSPRTAIIRSISSHISPTSKFFHVSTKNPNPNPRSTISRPIYAQSSSPKPNFFHGHINNPEPNARHGIARATTVDASPAPKVFHGQCYVLGDNIDTDQIIPAEYLTLLPSKPEEYEKLGSLALIGLPSNHLRFVEQNQTKSRFAIVIAGSNFGCGSSREHAPVCLGASGVKAVVAESYARIFFRNSVSTGEIYPVESEGRLCDECSTGDYVTVELENNRLINHSTGKEYVLKPIGDAGPVVEAGGIFAYARKTGMISSATA